MWLCAEGYALGRSVPTCSECPDSTDSYMGPAVVICVLAASAVIYAAIYAARPYAESLEQRLLSWFLATRCSGWLNRAITVYDRIVEEGESVSTSLLDVFKVLATFFQVVTTVFKLDIEWPSIFEDWMKKFSFVNLEFDIPSVSCIFRDRTFYSQIVSATLGPLASFAVLAVPLAIGLLLDTTVEKRQKLRALFSKTVLLIIFLIYPLVSKLCLSFFNCDEIYLSLSDFVDDEPQSFLRLDYRIDCRSDEYKGYRVFAIIMVCIWPVGEPILFMAMLYWYRIPQMARQRHEAAVHSRFIGFCLEALVNQGKNVSSFQGRPHLDNLDNPQLQLLASVTEGAGSIEEGEVVDNTAGARDLAQGFMTAIIAQSNVEDSAEADETPNPPEEKSRAELIVELQDKAQSMLDAELIVLPVLFWRSDVAEEAVALANLGMLISAYECKKWWFEIAELLRKLVQISVLETFLAKNPTSFLVAGFLISFMSLVGTAALKPYVAPELDRLQTYSLVMTCLTMFYGILLAVDTEIAKQEGGSEAVGAIMLALNLVIILVPLVELCWTYGSALMGRCKWCCNRGTGITVCSLMR